MSLADPTHAVVTDGSDEAEYDVERERLRAWAEQESGLLMDISEMRWKVHYEMLI